MSVDKTINFTERGAAPDTPATSDWRLYFKSGGLYIIDDAGTETLIGSGGSGADTALSNLAAVAINTSLISDTDSTDDLGSTSVYWRNAYLDTAYFTEQSAPSTPDAGKVVIYPKADGLMYSKDDAGTETLMSSGSGSGITASSTDTLTNKTIDADGTGNVITNIGAAEVKADLISGQSLITTVDGANDRLLIWDATDSTLKEVAPDDLPAGSGGLYTSVAILRDEKATTTAGGSASATTWNNRNLNTETYDPDNIVSISSNQFTPIAGDYIIEARAGARQVNTNRLRLYNVTGAASVEEGLNTSSNASDATTSVATLVCKFTANGTDAYRIDHYTTAARATDGLGAAVSDGSAECYMEIILTKVA